MSWPRINSVNKLKGYFSCFFLGGGGLYNEKLYKFSNIYLRFQNMVFRISTDSVRTFPYLLSGVKRCPDHVLDTQVQYRFGTVEVISCIL